MREKIHRQLRLVSLGIEHDHARELEAMSVVLDEARDTLAAVQKDLLRGVRPDVGRQGLTAEQTLRALVIKQMNGFSYDELAFHLEDSTSYRRFCRFGVADRTPSRSTLQRNIKRIRPETLETINRNLVKQAQERGVENGRKVRVDCTVEKSNIHAPTDSSLLYDSIRVLSRWLHRTRELHRCAFSDHSKRAKRRVMGILHAKWMKARRPLYRDLLEVARSTIRYAENAERVLGRRSDARAVRCATVLRHHIHLAKRVIEQTIRRVFQEERLSPQEKVVSIFEPHTDIIVKGNRETFYGHKVVVTTGASGIVLDCVVEHGNPNDSTLAVKMAKRQRDILGGSPRQMAFDGGFATKANVRDIKALGVKDVAFSKSCGLTITEMVKSSWVYKRLRRFRAGVEGDISFLKRCFGLDICNWSGFVSFTAYTWASVVSANLLLLARAALQ